MPGIFGIEWEHTSQGWRRKKAKNPKTKSEEEYETEDDTTITEVL